MTPLLLPAGDDTPIMRANGMLSVRAETILMRRMQLQTLGDVAGLTRSALLAERGIGAGTISEIEAWLSENGRALTPGPTPALTPEPTPVADDTPITQANGLLPVRAERILQRMGVKTVGGVAGLTRTDFLNTPMLGVMTLSKIEYWLSENGRALTPERAQAAVDDPPASARDVALPLYLNGWTLPEIVAHWGKSGKGAATYLSAVIFKGASPAQKAEWMETHRIAARQRKAQTQRAFIRCARINPDALRSARIAASLTQAQTADAIGLVNPDVIRRWEKGETQPDATHLLRLMLVYDITNPRTLLTLPDNPPPATE